jgi:type IV pilus assembly protein PilO
MADANQKQTALLLGLLAVLGGYVFYSGTGLDMLGMQGIQQRNEAIAAKQDTLTQLQAQVDSAKTELRKGTVDDLRRAVDRDRASLVLLRRLVPERNEVPNLLDDISTRAKIRGVSLSAVSPLPVEPGPPPFDTHKYAMAVVGRYDQIGRFLADIASLQRIIVPADLAVAPANAATARAVGDTSGALLEAKFQIRTFVKASAEEGAGGN